MSEGKPRAVVPPSDPWNDPIEFIEALMNADMSYAELPITNPHLRVRDVIEQGTWERDLEELRYHVAHRAVAIDPKRLALRDALRPFAEADEDTIRSYETGTCDFCGGGWEQVPGPRGGKGKLTNTERHEDDCPIVIARAAFAAQEKGA